MSYSSQTANLGLPQYAPDDKPTYLVDANEAYRKIDAAAGEAKMTGQSNTSAITAMQNQQNTDTQRIDKAVGDIALIKTNQTAVNQHLTDVDNEINALDMRVESLEQDTGTSDNVYTKSESDAKFATAEQMTTASNAITTLNGTVADNAEAITTLNATVEDNTTTLNATKDQLVAGDVKFQFGVDADGNYGYVKEGADTVTPFSWVKLPTYIDIDTSAHEGYPLKAHITPLLIALGANHVRAEFIGTHQPISMTLNNVVVTGDITQGITINTPVTNDQDYVIFVRPTQTSPQQSATKVTFYRV